MLGDGKETKRKRELIKADSTAEDEDEEEVKEEGSKVGRADIAASTALATRCKG